MPYIADENERDMTKRESISLIVILVLWLIMFAALWHFSPLVNPPQSMKPNNYDPYWFSGE